MLTDVELGWMAGLLEGEGHFRYKDCTQCVTLRMTDEDIVIRYAGLVKKLTGRTPHMSAIPPTGRMTKEIYSIQIHGDMARKVMRSVVPLMGHRRKAKIWQSLNEVAVKAKTLNELGFTLDVGGGRNALQQMTGLG